MRIKSINKAELSKHVQICVCLCLSALFQMFMLFRSNTNTFKTQFIHTFQITKIIGISTIPHSFFFFLFCHTIFDSYTIHNKQRSIVLSSIPFCFSPSSNEILFHRVSISMPSTLSFNYVAALL